MSNDLCQNFARDIISPKVPPISTTRFPNKQTDLKVKLLKVFKRKVQFQKNIYFTRYSPSAHKNGEK